MGTNENSYGHALLQSRSRPLMKTRSLKRKPPRKKIGFAPLWTCCFAKEMALPRTSGVIEGWKSFMSSSVKLYMCLSLMLLNHSITDLVFFPLVIV